jgi:hypothetical protein
MRKPYEGEDSNELTIENIDLGQVLIFVPGYSRGLILRLFAIWEHRIEVLLEKTLGYKRDAPTTIMNIDGPDAVVNTNANMNQWKESLESLR